MWRLILGGVVCAGCILVAARVRLIYRGALDTMRSWHSLVLWVREQMSFALTPLPTLIRRWCADHPGALSHCIVDYPILSALPPKGVSVGQWQAMRGALEGLGQSHLEGQAMLLDSMQQQAQQWVQEALDNVQSKGQLYARLCVIVGIGAMILMM